MNTLLIESIGWLGTALTISAYFLNLKGYFLASNRIYIAMNLVGGILLVINTVFHAAYPAAIENSVWALMAFWALWKHRKTPAIPEN